MNSIARIIKIGLLAAILNVAQVTLAFLPNIEIVTLLIIIFALNYKLSDTILIVVVFSTIQWLIYGFHTWAIMYYVIFSLYAIIVYTLKKHINDCYKCALLSAFFGLIFGSLHAIPYLFLGGINSMIAYIINGLLFDLVHSYGNYVAALILFNPINAIIKKTL